MENLSFPGKKILMEENPSRSTKPCKKHLLHNQGKKVREI
jgi:hypothetical protein